VHEWVVAQMDKHTQVNQFTEKKDQLFIPTVSATAWQSLKIQSVASSSLKAARRINGDPSSATI